MQTNTNVLFFLRHTSINHYVISRPVFSFARNKSQTIFWLIRALIKLEMSTLVEQTSYFLMSKGKYKNSIYIIQIQYIKYFTAYQTSDNDFN